MSKELYWLGPGVFGTGGNMLRPGDPLPSNFSKENLKRFEKKIGEKLERGVIEDVKTLKKHILEHKKKIKQLEEENAYLREKIDELKNSEIPEDE